MSIEWLDPFDPDYPFPPVDTAFTDPDGLLAAGGDLSPKRLLRAYQRGIFPWYEAGQPILWWSPNPRAVLYPERFRITRSLRKSLRRKPYIVSFDRAFRDVVLGCAAPRRRGGGTWITNDMLEAYCQLHAQGCAHSVEVWHAQDGQLIGGLYGVALGRIFFGESMFSWAPDASKIGFAYLARHLQAWEYPLIDCQLPSPHMESLGAEMISRSHFLKMLTRYCPRRGKLSPWQIDPSLEVAAWRPAPSDRESCQQA
jgi:leucyl/phenylalanyl-tRNA---protein transferase